MGKRSNFTRRPQDAYDTPMSAVAPLLPYLPSSFTYVEPCAGSGDLIQHIGGLCVQRLDLAPRHHSVQRADALNFTGWIGADYIITNPPWTRQLLHPMIEAFRAIAPTWLLFDADWAHTKQAIPYLQFCHRIVSVGRVKWIPDSPYSGKDNCAWYLFDKSPAASCQFHGRAA